jgi:uncharacterized OB-fold protein
VSSPAAHRNADWKYGFVAGARDGEVHVPPSPQDDLRTPMADVRGTIVTFTVDRLSYSVSPPIVFAIVDFDGGGRFPVELTDVSVDEPGVDERGVDEPGVEQPGVAIGDRVEMTFRKLFTADGIHNYFWKARPLRDPAGSGSAN